MDLSIIANDHVVVDGGVGVNAHTVSQNHVAANRDVRITDNWLELSLRFIVDDHKSRAVRDQIAREILEEFDKAGIGIASTTIDIVALPPLRGALPIGDGAQRPVPRGPR